MAVYVYEAGSGPCSCLDLGLSGLQNYEKDISVIYKPLWYSVISQQPELRHLDFNFTSGLAL